MDIIPSVLSDLIAGLAASGIVASAAVLARKLGWGAARRVAGLLGWPSVAAVFFGVSLTSAFLRGNWEERVIVLSVVLALTASVMLLRFGPERLEHAVPVRVQPLVRFVRAYPWRILTTIFFLITITLLALNLASDGDGRPSERITFVVSLDDTELIVFRDILDELEPELGAEVFLMNVDSGRYVSRLDKMRASSDMKWDLIAVDNNKLGLLAAKDLVEEVPADEYTKLYPESLMISLLPLRAFDEKFYFVPFRPNVKIAFYNEEKFAEYGLEPPRDWDQLLEVARVFKEKEGVGRVAIQGYPGPAAAVTLFEFVKAAGEDPLTLDDDGSRKAFEFLQEMEPYLAPEYVETTFNTANELLIDDQVYLVDNWTFGIKVVVEDAGKEEIKAYSGWSAPEGDEVHVLGGDVLAVPKGAPHADLAIRLMELLVSKETQQELLSRLRWLPVRTDAYGGVDPELAPYFEAVKEAMSCAEARSTEPEWTLAEDILDRAFQALVVNGEDIGRLKKYAEEIGDLPTFVPYPVQPGDTLTTIARQYRSTAAIIAEANCMTTGTSIGPGQILLVPRR